MPSDDLAQISLNALRFLAPAARRPTSRSPATDSHQAPVARALAQLGEIILGKRVQLKLTLACLLARGHLLIEDLPGVGKTTLAQSLAACLGLRLQRIQFTSDLLPADITGVSIFDRTSGSFKFHPGPIFAQIILADEVNRATPKAQSALLEAMEERQVTVEGETRALPEPFFVIATQNPSHQIGTFPLPESQLDRFLMRLRLGYPDPQAERLLLEGRDRRAMLSEMSPCLGLQDIERLQGAVREVFVSPAILDYLQALLTNSRDARAFPHGLSPRAGLSLLQAARAWALVEGRSHVLPEDLQAVLPAVSGHRLQGSGSLAAADGEELARRLVESVALP